jgi:hypothetical protein
MTSYSWAVPVEVLFKLMYVKEGIRYSSFNALLDYP